MAKYDVILFATLCAFLLFGLIFAIPAAFRFPQARLELESFRKTECTIINCVAPYYPKQAEVTYQSHEYFSINKTYLTDNCKNRPIGSSLPCWVNANNLLLTEPSRITDGLVLLSLACFFASGSFIIALIWIAKLRLDRRRSQSKGYTQLHTTTTTPCYEEEDVQLRNISEEAMLEAKDEIVQFQNISSAATREAEEREDD